MTPLGHLSISYLGGSLSKKLSMSAVIVGGLLPDIDVALIFFPIYNEIHRTATHNLFFVLIAALISGFLLRKKKRFGMIFISVALGGFLHLFVDSSMDANPTNGIGIAFFWPLYDGCFSLFNIRKPDWTAGWVEPWKMIIPILRGMIYEAPVILIAAFVLIIKKKQKKSIDLNND